MFKNVSSQKVAVFAWDNAAGSEKTGDAANISAQISKDGAACAVTNDVAPTELDAVDAPGIYIFDMTQAETNADLIVISPVSATGDVVLRPVIIYTQTVMRGTDGANTTVPDAAGIAPTAAEIKTAMEAEGASDLDLIADAVSHGTYGLSALQVLTAAIQTDLDNGTDGLGALKTLIDAVPTAAEINNEIVDVIKTDVSAEMSQGAPPATPTIEEMIKYLYFKMRNKEETTASEHAIYDNAGTTKLFKAPISDDTTTFTKNEFGTGA